jgi:hypothetical protein
MEQQHEAHREIVGVHNMEKTMLPNRTFEQDTASRKATRLFLWFQLGAMIVVVSLIALQFHTLALGIVLVMLVLWGFVLFWLYKRYQMSPLLKEKRALQERANQLQEQLAEERQRLDETQKRREHLLRKEQSGREATLFNLQKHHIEKGLSTHPIQDAVIPGMEPKLKERLAELGIHTALDVTEEAVSQLAEFGTANRAGLMNWRSTLYIELDGTKPLKLPDYQLEHIQKKFQRLHAANDEKGKIAADYHQQITAALHANELGLDQLASVTFRGYLVNALLPQSSPA